jgi:hypothetical protein
MDPTATLIALLDAIGDKDRDGASNALDDLMSWIERGGFVPNVEAAIETLKERERDK